MPYKWTALSAVMLGTIMAPLDGSIVNIALPTIARSFHHSVDDAAWILLGYFLALASTLIIFGRLGDMLGQKRIYLSGFAVFAIASAACSFATSLWLLVVARAIQGIGAAMLQACSAAIITNAFPAAQRGRGIGANGAAVAIGLAAGPTVGGIILTYADWRWLFLINLPIASLGIAWGSIVLRDEARERRAFDPMGAVFCATTLLLICLLLSRLHVWGYASSTTLIASAASFVGIALFLFTEQRTNSPMLDLRLFRNHTFAFSVLAALLYFVALYCVVFSVPLAMQERLGYTALQAGITLTPLLALSIVLAPVAGFLSERISARYISSIGALAFGAGALGLALQQEHVTPHATFLWLLVCGLGVGTFSQPNNSAIMGNVPARERGVAAGLLGTSRSVGMALGTALAGALYFGRAAEIGHAANAFAPASAVLFAAAVIAGLVVIISYWRGDTVRH